MLKHNYEDWSKPIQELIQMMRDDYPNEFELIITPIGAEMRSTLTTRVFAPADDNITNDLSRMVGDFFEAVKKPEKSKKTAIKVQSNERRKLWLRSF